MEPWYKPPFTWPNLWDNAVRRLAGFVTTSSVDTLCNRDDIDAGTALKLSKAVGRAIDPGSIGLLKSEPESEAGPEAAPEPIPKQRGGN